MLPGPAFRVRPRREGEGEGRRDGVLLRTDSPRARPYILSDSPFQIRARAVRFNARLRAFLVRSGRRAEAEFSCMRDEEVTRGVEGLKVVCVWCGGVIRAAAPKPSQGMCQQCFARMMREHSRAHRLRSGWRDASDR